MGIHSFRKDQRQKVTVVVEPSQKRYAENRQSLRETRIGEHNEEEKETAAISMG